MNELIKISEDGKVTARELYEFLLLNSSNFAKWMKVNITDNQFACEDTDYKVFVPQYENSKGGRPGQDAELSIEFAKKTLHDIALRTRRASEKLLHRSGSSIQPRQKRFNCT